MYTYNLGQRFETIAQQYKDKAAIVFDNGTLVTFTELHILSNKIANYLLKKGVKLKDVIAIQNGKGIYGYATMLACVKIGVIYTNFDDTNPEERIKKVWKTAEPVFIVVENESCDNIICLCRELEISCIHFSNHKIKEEVGCCANVIMESVTESVCGNHPAYLMFTSGSTGNPKGVVIKQRSVLNFIAWAYNAFGLNDMDIMTNVNPMYFDNSVFDFYVSLFHGITMVAISKEVLKNPNKLIEIIDREQCTVWFSVPSLLIYLTNLKLLTKNTLQHIRLFSFGGEGYPKELLKKMYDLYSDKATFYNVYGPTEATCICSAYQVMESDFLESNRFVSLGNIASNFEYLILTDEQKKNDIGELCLMGEQLALGYYMGGGSEQGRTEKVFVQNPFCNQYTQIMYKTGDLVQKKDDKLYFLGRVDNQIKHMGYRIELEEIEAALIQLPHIKQCAVIHRIKHSGISQLIAFVATDAEREEIEFRNELRQYIPDYMLPSQFVLYQELPKNANGKVDRVYLKELAEQYT